MEKLLPIGTVVKLAKVDQLFMIIGYCGRLKLKKTKKHDYFGCPYPVGLIGFEKTILIKHENIEKICHMGYNSEKLKKINTLINAFENIDFRGEK